MSEKLSTWQTLRYKFPPEEYVLIQEVSDASGFSRSRSLDYMLINLWESRGLAVTGIEQKSFRNDWQKELKNPAKQENHYKYCDYFYLLTDKENVAKIEEIPINWGWMHINEKGMLKTLKAAPKLTPMPIGRSLLCAMLRRAASKQNYTHNDNIESQIQLRAESLQKQMIGELEQLRIDYKNISDDVAEFEKASGVRVGGKWNFEGSAKIGEAVRVIISGEASQYSERLKRMLAQIENMAKDMSNNISNIEKIQILTKSKELV